jgi:protein-tyrosine phosphatase
MKDLSGVTAEWQRGDHWSDYRSQGYARAAIGGYGSKGMDAAWFDAPLISHIVDNLWQGGCEDGVDLDDDFAVVVSLYPWGKYNIHPDTTRVEIEMYDDHDGVSENDLFTASDAVLSGLERGKVLVHCQAGLNRSGLVAGFTLMRLGWSAQDAIDHLRRTRSNLVLCNKTFVKQLHDLEHRREEWAT